MNFWVAVIFFCHGGECSFWKATDVYDTKTQCEGVLAGALDVFEPNTDAAAGGCLEIKLVKA